MNVRSWRFVVLVLPVPCACAQAPALTWRVCFLRLALAQVTVNGAVLPALAFDLFDDPADLAADTCAAAGLGRDFACLAHFQSEFAAASVGYAEALADGGVLAAAAWLEARRPPSSPGGLNGSDDSGTGGVGPSRCSGGGGAGCGSAFTAPPSCHQAQLRRERRCLDPRAVIAAAAAATAAAAVGTTAGGAAAPRPALAPTTGRCEVVGGAADTTACVASNVYVAWCRVCVHC